MAKKNGKAKAQVEAQANEKQNDNLFLNGLKEGDNGLIHDVKSVKHDGNGNEVSSVDWKSIHFLHHTTEAGDKVYASFLVRPGAVMDSTKRVKNSEGEYERVPNPGFKNVLLGKPDATHEIAINDKDYKPEGVEEDAIKRNKQGYPLVSMTNQQIFDTVKANEKAHYAAKKAEKAASKEVPDIAPEAGDTEEQFEA